MSSTTSCTACLRGPRHSHLVPADTSCMKFLHRSTEDTMLGKPSKDQLRRPRGRGVTAVRRTGPTRDGLTFCFTKRLQMVRAPNDVKCFSKTARGRHAFQFTREKRRFHAMLLGSVHFCVFKKCRLLTFTIFLTDVKTKVDILTWYCRSSPGGEVDVPLFQVNSTVDGKSMKNVDGTTLLPNR